MAFRQQTDGSAWAQFSSTHSHGQNPPTNWYAQPSSYQRSTPYDSMQPTARVAFRPLRGHGASRPQWSTPDTSGGPTGAEVRAEALRNAPKPDQDYMQQAYNTPYAMSTRQKLLIILDLNGTLLVRPTRKRGAGFIKRPFVEEFIKKCIEEHQVMVWSSAQPDSVAHMMNGITTMEQRDRLAAIWTRKQLRLSASAYREKVQVYKCLTWVWDDEKIQSTHPGAAHGHMWDQTNTVLIDDSYLKASSEPFNHVEVSEFSESMLAAENATPVLKELLAYLEEASHFEDVSTFIRSHPFKMPTIPQPVQPAQLVEEQHDGVRYAGAQVIG